MMNIPSDGVMAARMSEAWNRIVVYARAALSVGDDRDKLNALVDPIAGASGLADSAVEDAIVTAWVEAIDHALLIRPVSEDALARLISAVPRLGLARSDPRVKKKLSTAQTESTAAKKTLALVDRATKETLTSVERSAARHALRRQNRAR